MVFYSDDAGSSFNVSSSTPYETARNQLKGMNEAAFAQLSNGSVLLVMRNLGGHQEHTPGAFHNPACADNGICKAFSRSDDLGLTYVRRHSLLLALLAAPLRAGSHRLSAQLEPRRILRPPPKRLLRGGGARAQRQPLHLGWGLRRAAEHGPHA